jgi:hypothetical protein
VGHKYIDTWKCSQCGFDLQLIEKVVALWLVFPRAAKSSECDTANSVAVKMKIDDGILEGRTAVVIALDG